ncbi:MAG: DinB family protein [Gemmatimonadales bacterium]
MTIGQRLLPEFDQEMATTRRLLERVPSDQGAWKPHAKSFPLGHLAQLVARMPGWIVMAIQRSELDLGGGNVPGYSLETTDTLLREFDQHVKAAREALSAAPDEDFGKPWALKFGGQVLFSSTRGATVRQTISHLVHHRGQLTVYLRLLDVPIPSIYGPTADERAW